jgi:hypothetical protein
MRPRRIALALPYRNFGVEDGAITDAPIQALPAQHADLDWREGIEFRSDLVRRVKEEVEGLEER